MSLFTFKSLLIKKFSQRVESLCDKVTIKEFTPALIKEMFAQDLIPQQRMIMIKDLTATAKSLASSNPSASTSTGQS